MPRVDYLPNPYGFTNEEIEQLLKDGGVAVHRFIGSIGANPIPPHEMWWTLTIVGEKQQALVDDLVRRNLLRQVPGL